MAAIFDLTQNEQTTNWYSQRSASDAKRRRHGFECPNCGRGFTEKRALVRHCKHTSCSGRPIIPQAYVCQSCSKKCTRADALLRHVREKHNGLRRTSTANTSSSTSEDIHTPIALFTTHLDVKVPRHDVENAFTTSPDLDVTSFEATNGVQRPDEGCNFVPEDPDSLNNNFAEHIEASKTSSDSSLTGDSALTRSTSAHSASISTNSSLDKLVVESLTIFDTGLAQKPVGWYNQQHALPVFDPAAMARVCPTIEIGLPMRARLSAVKHAPLQRIKSPSSCIHELGDDQQKANQHMEQHIAEFTRPLGAFHCIECNISFQLECDFVSHTTAAPYGCSLAFRHHSPCTGHHPAGTIDHTRFQARLRGWESAQLQGFQIFFRDYMTGVAKSNVPDFGDYHGTYTKSAGYTPNDRVAESCSSTPACVNYDALFASATTPVNLQHSTSKSSETLSVELIDTCKISCEEAQFLMGNNIIKQSHCRNDDASGVFQTVQATQSYVHGNTDELWDRFFPNLYWGMD